MKISFNKDNLTLYILVGIYSWCLIENNIYRGLHLSITNYFTSQMSTLITLIVLSFLIIIRGNWSFKILIFESLLVMAVCLSFLNKDASVYLRELYGGFSQIKLYFIIPLSFICIKDPQRFIDLMSRTSIVIGAVHIYTFVNMGYLTEWNTVDYMSFGMEMLLPVSIIMMRAFETKNKIYKILSIVYSGYVIVFAHRSASLTIFILFATFFYMFSTNAAKIRISLFTIVIGIIVFLTSNEIIRLLIFLVEKVGIDSRNLSFLMEGGLLSDSGRGEIWKICVEHIKENIFIGNGIGADRVLLANTLGNFYAHNFILELMIAFGFVIGLILSILIIWMGIHCFFMKQCLEWRDLFMPFYIVSIVTLLFSSSIFEFQPMWISIIIFLMLIKKERIEKYARSYGNNYYL